MAVVGIDLGTTNTVVAAVRDGRATALKDNRGRALLPSVVTLPAEGEPVVGYDAKENRSRDAENTIFSIKRLIGRSWESEHVQKARQRFPFELKEGPGKATLVRSRGADYTLPEISALVLERARAIAEERLGEPVNEVVITVPANFNDLQRAATKVAARVAGLEVLRILNEPTAAALAYGFGKKGRERIAVYDFGGGTFDITLLDLSENVFEVLATAGDTFLGGDDIDVAIVEAMADELKRKHGVDTDKHASVREQLRLAAEKLKIDLSTRSMAKVLVEDIGHGRLSKKIDFEFSMKRADFEKLCEPWVERTLVVCQEALNIAGIGTKDLDQVLLVGGSTRIPLVRRRVSSFFGKMPQSRVNPDEVVAIGAAIQAAALESKSASLLPPETHKSSRPPAARSQFPSSPGVTTGTLARPGAGGTKTGLAGLRKTMPGTGGDAPAAADATREGSILSALPRASAATRPDMPAVRLPQREDDGDERGPRTLMGVGEPDPGAVGGPAPKPPGAGLPEGTGRNYKTLAGVGPDGSPLMAAGPTGPTTFKTLTGSPTGTGPLPLKTLSGVAPGPRTGPGNVKTGPLKTLSGVGSPLEEPSAGRATSGSTLSRLPGLSDSRSTSGSTLSKLGPSDGRSASSLPPRGPALSTPSSSDFEEITSIYPATPSVAPPSELSPLRTASQRPAASPAPVVPAPGAKTPAAPAAVVPAAPATATAKASPAAGESSHDPFADLPASDDDLDLPSAVPPPAATDGSVIFDFADLTEDEPDAPSHGPEDEVDLPARSTRGLDLPAQGFDATRIGGTNADLPARPAAAEFEPTVARREPAAARPAALDLPAAKPMDLPAARAPDLPAARGPGLPAVRAPDLPAGRAPGLPAQRMPVPLADAPSGDLDTDELSLSAIALDDLEAEAAELDTDEFAPPSSGSLDLSDQLGGTRLGVAPPAAPPLAGPAAMGAPPESLRTALGPNAFDAALERTALGPSAAAPISASTLGAARPAGAPVERAAPLARTALGVAPPAQNWDRTSPAGSAPTEEGVAVRRDATGALQAPLLIDVTPLSLGVETVGGYVDQLIERNSPIPCERTRTFATARDEQTLVRVRVSQGEANRFEANTVLGEVELSGLSPGPRGSVKVDVTFSLDESGMLQVAARDTRTGQKANAVLRLVGLSAHGS